MDLGVSRPVELRHFVDLPRFGPFHYTSAEVIRFPWGMPGLADLRNFLALSVPDNERYYWLQSLERLDLALPLVDPWSIFATYAPVLSESAQESLEITHPSDFATLCVVVTEQGGNITYVNLLAPIIINIRRMIGRQVLLENTSYDIRTLVPKAQSTVEQ